MPHLTLGRGAMPMERSADTGDFHSTRTARPSLFEVRDASLTLSGRPILEKIDFVVRRNEFISVVGASGCGKTSLLRLMAGLARPTIGEVHYDGTPILRPHREIAIVFQDY